MATQYPNDPRSARKPFFLKLPEPKNKCIYNEILSLMDAPLAQSWVASCTLVNTLLKAQVIHTTDREQQYGCLRRKEKLQENIN